MTAEEKLPFIRTETKYLETNQMLKPLWRKDNANETHIGRVG